MTFSRSVVISSWRDYLRYRYLMAIFTILFSWMVGFVFCGAGGYLPDDGAYAYVASKVLDGAVLGRDVQDVHFGLIHYINALWLWLFGSSFLGLRYGLVLLAVAQALLVFQLFHRGSAKLALVAVFAMTTLGVIQFVNPTANWYALFFTLLLICLLESREKYSDSFLILLGVVAGLVFSVRQLTGVFVGMALVVFILCRLSMESQADSDGLGVALAKIIVCIVASGLLGYLSVKASAISFLLYGVWSVIACMTLAFRIHVENHLAVRSLSFIMLGWWLALAPLILQQWFFGDIPVWLDDVLLASLRLTELNFFSEQSYFSLVIDSVINFESGHFSLVDAFFLTQFIAPLLLGYFMVVSVMREKVAGLSAVPLFAIFYMLVSVHYEIQIYQGYSAAIIFVALVSLCAYGRLPFGSGYAVLLFVCIGALLGLIYKASSVGLLGSQAIDVDKKFVECEIERCGIKLPAADRHILSQEVDEIVRLRGDTRLLLVIPGRADLYFLTSRVPPVRFFNSELGLSSAVLEDEVRRVCGSPLQHLLVDERDKYFGVQSRMLLSRLVACGFRREQEMVGGMQLYKRAV